MQAWSEKAGGCARLAVPGEIVRAGAQHPADLADTPLHQGAIRQVSNSQRDVNVEFHQIDCLIGKHESCGDLLPLISRKADFQD